MMKPIAVMFPLALLAACSRGDQPADGNATEVTSVNETIVSEPAPLAPVDNGITSAPKPSPSSSGDTAQATAGQIPAAFHGRWGITANDCDPKRDDNKGLMTVAAGSLKFYESLAKPRAVTIVSADEISAKLDWSGEGQTWQTITKMTLADGGRTLIRASTDEGDLRYSRCAA